MPVTGDTTYETTDTGQNRPDTGHSIKKRLSIHGHKSLIIAVTTMKTAETQHFARLSHTN